MLIHIPLPNEPARREVLHTHGVEHFAGFPDQDFEAMARITKGCLGSDVVNLV